MKFTRILLPVSFLSPPPPSKRWSAAVALLSVAVLASPGAIASARPHRPALSDDWPDWRGPARDGISSETGLPESWSPDGENLAWVAPYGGRSTPIVLGNRLYLQTGVGEGATRQGRVVCLNADTGELMWEHRYNISLSDVPPRRVGWASPVGDPATGNVYAFAVDGRLLALSPAGELLWERFLSEIFGTLSTHGGRTVSPIIEGGNVIVSSVSTGWGALARPAHRFFAFDKSTGEVVWVGASPNRPYDTTYSPPIVHEINGARLLIQGGSDGAVHALQANTGELVWSFPMSKRGINTGVLIYGDTAIVTHGEENLDTSTMGAIAAIPAGARGAIDKGSALWSLEGHLGGYSSPVLDGDRIYQIDNGANLVAFAVDNGEELWRQNLGTIQRSSPVLADGKLYVGTQNGTFSILRPSAHGVEVLDRDELTQGDRLEEIRGSVAVARGRIYLATGRAIYAIGPAAATTTSRTDRGGVPGRPDAPSIAGRGGADPLEGREALQPGAPGPVAHLQVVPKELAISPGETVRFEARLFNANGELIRVEQAGGGQAGVERSGVAHSPSVEWSTGNLRGEFVEPGVFVAAEDGAQAGQIEASIQIEASSDRASGTARLRVMPRLPIEEDFEGLERSPGHWLNAGIKYEVREVDGNKVYVKTTPLRTKRARSFIGMTDWADMTIQVDVRSAVQRRRMADAGVVAQRYELLLMGNKQTLELSSWRAEDQRAIVVPFRWQPDTWYTIKLRTENRVDGGVHLLGKAWLRGEAEPDEWMIDHVDPEGNRYGSPGIYGDAHAEVMFDNLKVTSDR